jgi:hypothetical protein
MRVIDRAIGLRWSGSGQDPETDKWNAIDSKLVRYRAGHETLTRRDPVDVIL